jgi:hypothetical protein
MRARYRHHHIIADCLAGSPSGHGARSCAEFRLVNEFGPGSNAPSDSKHSSKHRVRQNCRSTDLRIDVYRDVRALALPAAQGVASLLL